MVAPIRALLPVGGTFLDYTIHERLIDACLTPRQAFAATKDDGRATLIYCQEATSATRTNRAVFATRLDRLSRIQHERIPGIVNGGLDDWLFWVAVEAIEGSSLFDQVRSDGPLDPMHVVMMLRDAVAPLRIARDVGVFHGRLTPRHLLTTAAECRAVLEIGFDLLFGPAEEKSDVVYRAPEQLDPSRRIDERADIYALGTMAYFALGVPPFEDPKGAFNLEKSRRQVLTEALPPISHVRAGCPPEIGLLLRSLCAKREEDRPQSLEILSEMLDHALAACVAHRKGKTIAPFPQSPAGPIDVPPSAALAEGPAGIDVDRDAHDTRKGGGVVRAPHKPAPPPRAKEPPLPVLRSGPAGQRIATGAALVLSCVAVLVSTAALFLAWRQPPAVAIADPSTPALQPTGLVELTVPPPPEPPAPRAVELPLKAPPSRRHLPASAAQRPAEPSAAHVPASERRGRTMRYQKEAP